VCEKFKADTIAKTANFILRIRVLDHRKTVVPLWYVGSYLNTPREVQRQNISSLQRFRAKLSFGCENISRRRITLFTSNSLFKIIPGTPSCCERRVANGWSNSKLRNRNIMFDAFPWKNFQIKLINLQQDTNVKFSQTKNAKISIRSCRRTYILKPGPKLRITAKFKRILRWYRGIQSSTTICI
jgi:hypothetical protein